MSEMEPKMMAILRILQIYEKFSDANHPLTQAMIIDKLESLYGIKHDRKAISNKISLLKEAGYDIVSDRKGSYLNERVFDDSELHFLIDCVYGSKMINQRHTEDLIDKLKGMSNEHFVPKSNKLIPMGTARKGDNPSLFYNIDLVYEAISKERQISYDYNLYGVDKQLHKSSSHIISPYQLLFHQQGYYLMGYSQKHKRIVFHMLDHMTDMKITKEPIVRINSVRGYENGLPPDYFTSARPYMYADPPERIEMIVSKQPYIINQLIEWFGKDIAIDPISGEDDVVKVNFRGSPMAMKLWALQYADYVEVISPYTLRDEIRDSLTFALERYES